MDDLNVELDKPGRSSKVLVVAISILTICLITGGITWYYLQSKTDSTTTETNNTETLTETSDVETISTNLASTIEQLNNELSAMAADESSTDDEVPTL